MNPTTSLLRRGRSLQMQIAARGGPPPAMAAQFRKACDIMDNIDATLRRGELGFWWLLLPLLGGAVVLLARVASATATAAEAGVQEVGKQAGQFAAIAKWIGGGALAIWAWRKVTA